MIGPFEFLEGMLGPMNRLPDILHDLHAGRMVVLVDDEQRENEGDLVCAAEHVTPEVINFMLREGRGMLFTALDGAICDRLELAPQSQVNTTQRGTAYTISVDAAQRFGITTGVSAADRAQTVRTLVDSHTQPTDLDRPGHIQPLRAKDGGVLVRAGHTEGIVDLCRLAGLRGGGVGIEIMNQDGTMARLPQIESLCNHHGLKLCSVAQVIKHRIEREKLIERIDEMPMANQWGQFRLIAYRSRVDPFPHVALVVGDIGRVDATGQVVQQDQPVLVRMHSQNLLGDVFHDVSQPSGQTLSQAMRMIQAEGRGAIVYLRHEGMGSGLLKQLQTASLPQAHALAGSDSLHMGQTHQTPGTKPPQNKMDYGIGSQILRDLGIANLRLITHHPFTPTALSGFGLAIDEFVPPHEP